MILNPHVVTSARCSPKNIVNHQLFLAGDFKNFITHSHIISIFLLCFLRVCLLAVIIICCCCYCSHEARHAYGYRQKEERRKVSKRERTSARTLPWRVYKLFIFARELESRIIISFAVMMKQNR
jgi:hypothetical protein